MLDDCAAVGTTHVQATAAGRREVKRNAGVRDEVTCKMRTVEEENVEKFSG